MRKIILATLLILTLPTGAAAYQDGPKNVDINLGTLINAQTLASARTATINGNVIKGYGIVSLYATVTDANDSETGVSVACTSAPTSGGTEYRVPTCVWDSGNTRYNCEAGPMFWNPSDETSPKSQVFRIDVEGLSNLTCSFTFVGGAAGDSITVTGRAAVK